MPNKTIYVSDDDLPLYQRAQELAGGSLSAAIVKALRRYIETEEGKAEGLKEITVRVGAGKGRKQRFVGVQVGEWGTYNSSTYAHWRLYLTRKDRFVVHVEQGPESVSKTEGWRTHLGLAPGAWGVRAGSSKLEVYNSLEELEPHIPAELYEMAVDATASGSVEDLDI